MSSGEHWNTYSTPFSQSRSRTHLNVTCLLADHHEFVVAGGGRGLGRLLVAHLDEALARGVALAVEDHVHPLELDVPGVVAQEAEHLLDLGLVGQATQADTIPSVAGGSRRLGGPFHHLKRGTSSWQDPVGGDLSCSLTPAPSRLVTFDGR